MKKYFPVGKGLGRIKLLLGASLIASLVLIVVAVWLTFATLRTLSDQASTIANSPYLDAQIESLKKEQDVFKRIQVQPCLDKAQTLIAFEPWLANPALKNLQNLKMACLGQHPAEVNHDQNKI